MVSELTIGETCYVTDGAHAKVKRQESGILYLTSKNITNGELKLDKVDWISEVDFNKLFSNTTKSQRLLQTGDVLMGIIGTLGNAYLYKSDDKFGISSSVAILRADPTKLMPEFLYYIVTSEKFKKTVEAYKGGSVQGYTNIATLKSLPIPYVTLNEQKKAAKVLSSLDKKIQLNKQTNQTLEQMAQALFKSWFVDFDPVFDNLLASVNFKLENLETSLPDELKQKAQRRLTALNSLENATEIKTSLSALAHELQAQLSTKEATQAAGQVSEKAAETPVKANFNANPTILAQHANTHAHFPNEFEHNEQLGWIPKGWELLSLESLVTLIGGGTPKTSIEEYWNGDIPWFSVVDAPQDSDIFVVDTEKHVTQLGVDKSSTKILRVGTTIISARGTVGKCAFVGTPMAMNQSCYGINGINGISDEFIYYLTRHQVSDLQKRGHGSVFNTITRETFKSILLPFSGDKLTEEFGKAVISLFDKILMNNRQNVELIKLRDTLLPKLISGELQIPDVATDEEVVD